MKKFILCLLLFGLVSTSQLVDASQMNSEVGIEFSSKFVEEKDEKTELKTQKNILPKTGEIKDLTLIYSFWGLIVLLSTILLVSKVKKRGGCS